jgi:hypothetical protein
MFEGEMLETNIKLYAKKQIENRATDAMENAKRCP